MPEVSIFWPKYAKNRPFWAIFGKFWSKWPLPRGGQNWPFLKTPNFEPLLPRIRGQKFQKWSKMAKLENLKIRGARGSGFSQSPLQNESNDSILVKNPGISRNFPHFAQKWVKKKKKKTKNYHHGVSRVGPLGSRGVFFIYDYAGRSENRLKRFSVWVIHLRQRAIGWASVSERQSLTSTRKNKEKIINNKEKLPS